MWNQQQTTPSPEDLIKSSRRQINRSQREIERELRQLDRQEKQLVTEIRKLAAKGQNSSVRTLAKQIVRIRQQRSNMLNAKAKLTTINTQTTAMRANLAMSRAISGSTLAMQAVNKSSDITQTSQTLREFEQQNELMNMKEELLDELLDDESDEEESDALVSQVFDEIGLELNEQLVDASRKTPIAARSKTKNTEDDKEVDKLLENLKVQ
jgi:division protein CdvB (Snf7/Vps24/ESCRT-III family)